jgi:glutathione S-transferase
MYTLYSAQPAFGVRSASPYATQAESLLRLAGVPYERVDVLPTKGPRGKVPFLKRPDGRIVSDTRNIRAELVAHGLSLAPSRHETPVRRVIEDSLYWAQMHFRWAYHPDEVRAEFFGGVPAPLRGLVFGNVRRQVTRTLWLQGFGRRPEAEQLAIVGEDLDALEAALGTDPLLGGERLAAVDLSAHGLLGQILGARFDDPLTRAVRARPALVAYHRRVEELVWPSDGGRARCAMRS